MKILTEYIQKKTITEETPKTIDKVSEAILNIVNNSKYHKEYEHLFDVSYSTLKYFTFITKSNVKMSIRYFNELCSYFLRDTKYFVFSLDYFLQSGLEKFFGTETIVKINEITNKHHVIQLDTDNDKYKILIKPTIHDFEDFIVYLDDILDIFK